MCGDGKILGVTRAWARATARVKRLKLLLHLHPHRACIDTQLHVGKRLIKGLHRDHMARLKLVGNVLEEPIVPDPVVPLTAGSQRQRLKIGQSQPQGA